MSGFQPRFARKAVGPPKKFPLTASILCASQPPTLSPRPSDFHSARNPVFLLTIPPTPPITRRKTASKEAKPCDKKPASTVALIGIVGGNFAPVTLPLAATQPPVLCSRFLNNLTRELLSPLRGTGLAAAKTWSIIDLSLPANRFPICARCRNVPFFCLQSGTLL